MYFYSLFFTLIFYCTVEGANSHTFHYDYMWQINISLFTHTISFCILSFMFSILYECLGATPKMAQWPYLCFVLLSLYIVFIEYKGVVHAQWLWASTYFYQFISRKKFLIQYFCLCNVQKCILEVALQGQAEDRHTLPPHHWQPKVSTQERANT